MVPASPPPSPIVSPRADARRAQVRAAAAACFREFGLHGTSIVQISKRAGMSTGHIYHYFENKEAIIADIVAENVQRLIQMTTELRNADDVKAAMLERAVEGVENNLDQGAAALHLEIIAEAARNPNVAAIVQAADRQFRESMAATLRMQRGNSGEADDETYIAGMVETMAAMFEGLQIRAIRNPDIDREAVVQVFRRMLGDLLGDEA